MLWYRFRKKLHRHGHHQLCRVLIAELRVVDHYDNGRAYLAGVDPTTGKEFEVDMTVFGGRPVYRTERRVVHG